MNQIEQVRARACRSSQRLTQSSLIGMMYGTGTANFLVGLNSEDWRIVSFDPISREVCIEVANNPTNIQTNANLSNEETRWQNVRHLSITVPAII